MLRTEGGNDHSGAPLQQSEERREVFRLEIWPFEGWMKDLWTYIGNLDILFILSRQFDLKRGGHVWRPPFTLGIGIKPMKKHKQTLSKPPDCFLWAAAAAVERKILEKEMLQPHELLPNIEAVYEQVKTWAEDKCLWHFFHA